MKKTIILLDNSPRHPYLLAAIWPGVLHEYLQKKKRRFHEIARASRVEMDTQVEISLILNFINKEEIIMFEKYETPVFRNLSKLINNFHASTHSPKTTSH